MRQVATIALFQHAWLRAVEEERHANLRAFEETSFAALQGVTDEHVTTLRRASTTTASRSSYAQSDDALGQAAYIAAALRGLAEAVAALQGTAAEPSRAAK